MDKTRTVSLTNEITEKYKCRKCGHVVEHGPWDFMAIFIVNGETLTLCEKCLAKFIKDNLGLMERISD